MTSPTTRHSGRAPARRGRLRATGLLPAPAPRVGAHAYAGKRVRDDAWEAVLVMAFSVAIAVGLAVSLTLLLRLAG